ncbi:MAG: ABC transporter permease subunit [Arenimonas sp.]|nr:ABC transporter permease subunit [Arenimonas sp.]MBP6309590.1 ABC transporter permease subunit [Arenimonas sp.]
MPFLALLKRELQSYLQTPLALVFVVIFLVMSNSFVFYLGDLYEIGQASMQSYFRLLPWVCLLLIPALTMRAWSEEFSSGTIEFLDSLPIPLWQMVLAKFLALWAISLSALALSFPLWISLSWLGQPDQGVIVLGYFGAAMLMATMIATALCVSAISENQLVVYIVSAMILLLSLLANYPLALNPIRELFSQQIVDLISSLSLLSYLQSITRGILQLRDIFFYGATILFWLTLNVLFLQSKKLRN